MHILILFLLFQYQLDFLIKGFIMMLTSYVLFFLTVEDFAGFVENTRTHSYSIILYVTFHHPLLHTE